MYHPVEALTLYGSETVGRIENFNVEFRTAGWSPLEIAMRDYYRDLRLSVFADLIRDFAQMLQCAGALAEEFSNLLELLVKAKEQLAKGKIYVSREAAAWIEKELPGRDIIIEGQGDLKELDLEKISAEELGKIIQALLDWINQLLENTEAKNSEVEKILH